MLTAEPLAEARAECAAIAAANEERALALMDAAALAAYRWSWTRRADYRARRIAGNARLYGPLSTHQQAFLVALHRDAESRTP